MTPEPEAKTWTNTVSAKPPEVDIDKISDVCRGLHNEFIQSFAGVLVKVDRELKGKSYYIAISPKLLAELEENNIQYESPTEQENTNKVVSTCSLCHHETREKDTKVNHAFDCWNR